MGKGYITCAIALAFVLAGCGENEELLEGERLDLRADLFSTDQGTEPQATPVNRSAPISLASPVANSSWTHPSGSPSHAIAHPALGRSLTIQWSADIGAGNSRRARLTADPVIVGNQIYTLDARARVTSLTTSGDLLWTRDLTPAQDRTEEASGGGISVAAGRLYVATAFGELHVLDATDGQTIWNQQLEAAATGAPTVSGNLVTVLTRDNRALGLDGQNGRIRWEIPGIDTASGLVGGASPAVADNRVVLPFSSGQLTAVTTADGAVIWTTAIPGERLGPTFARVLDVAADPVIAGGVVYGGTAAGRTVAMNVGTGQRLWTIEQGVQSAVWVAGGSVFMMSDENALLRLDAATGEQIWSTQLPLFRSVRRMNRLRDVFVHYGPVLAGGRLIVLSDDGLMRSFDPTDGTLLSVVELPGPAARPPVVAGNTLYLVTQDGVLHALR